jgi:hypothetical protein
MASELKQHIKIVGDNPLEAMVIDRRLKAYIIAQIALVDGADATAELYDLNLGTVYAAMSFYEDNREAIEAELSVAEKAIRENGIDAREAIAKFKKHMQDKQDS